MLKLGFAPLRRKSLSATVAAVQRREILAKVCSILPDFIDLVDITDICPDGMMVEERDANAIADKFAKVGVDALFLAFCDFGEECAAATLSARLKVPTLVWGPRDYSPNTDEKAGRDTQCGMFAATKVLARMGVTYSYIVSCPTSSKEFFDGFVDFIRVANIVKKLKNLRVAKFGSRPRAFMSVMANDAELAERFGIVTIPIAASQVGSRALKLIESNDITLDAYIADFTRRVDCSSMNLETVRKTAAIKLAMQALMGENACEGAAVECWSAMGDMLGGVPCLAIGELADAGLSAACEGDVNGAITLAILQACSLGDGSQFFADLTIRHPSNDNAELLWHCGPFPYSLKAETSRARYIDMQCRWELRRGDITICRFDSINGQYSLFAGEGRAVDGPETTGTYVWFEVDDWKKWEEKLIFGPYIHHVGGAYGRYTKALREAARYLGIKFDTPDTDRVYSL